MAYQQWPTKTKQLQASRIRQDGVAVIWGFPTDVKMWVRDIWSQTSQEPLLHSVLMDPKGVESYKNEK